MITKEQVAEAYLAQEKAKKDVPSGFLSGRTPYYCSSPVEPFATIALILQAVMFGWECENPAPLGKYWSCNGITGEPVLMERSL